MRLRLTSALLLLTCIAAFSQVAPVSVKSSFERIDSKSATLTFEATIDEGWHLYSTNLGDAGPIEASCQFEEMQNCSADGALNFEGNEIKKMDQMFECEVRYFENSVKFIQKIAISEDPFLASGYFEYGACNDESCLPPTRVDFKYGDGAAAAAPAPTQATASGAEALGNSKLWEPVEFVSDIIPADTTSLWLVFWSCFAGGFLALLTPCVWPIIPMTVSFFLKRTDKRSKGITDSITYGISIVVIYLTIGLSITYILGPNALNALSTNAVFNLIFTAMLIVFGISFLGAFELTLPASWSNAVDAKSEKTTGLLSIFLMAFTLSLVSFSCTGPIIGFLLVQVTTSGNFVAPAVGMAGFAIALALPFTLFALFPSWLKKMPKSGGWMVTIKAVLGFIELAFALKFFSVADLAYGWGILDRETFIAIWAALAIILALYLLGRIKLAHDDDDNHIGVTRLMCALASLAFAIYLIPGLWGAPLKAVSAFAPPMSTQDFDLDKSTPHAQFNDYEAGMAFAESAGKPALIDFTGHGCVNCRKMEQSVWTDKRVVSKINNDFVLVSLYVDDKTPLPEKITVEENGTTTTLRTVGDKWSYLQRVKFGVNAQPFYVILDKEGKLLTTPYAFDENADNFVDFLDKGLAK